LHPEKLFEMMLRVFLLVSNELQYCRFNLIKSIGDDRHVTYDLLANVGGADATPETWIT
jgi:hypothetical protein